MSDTKSLMLSPPPPPAEAADAWAAIEGEIRDLALRAAVLWTLHGESMREASRRTGVDRTRLNRQLRRLGVHADSFATKQLVGTHRRAAQLALEELERRLIDTPEDLRAAELNFIAGTSTDKLSKFERWGEKAAEAPSYASALEKLAGALAEGKIDLKIEVSRRDAIHEATTVEILPENPT